MKPINQVFKKERIRKFPQLSDIAAATGQLPGYWQDIESDRKGSNPTYEKMRYIIHELGINIVMMADYDEPVRAYDAAQPIPIQKTGFSEKDFKFLQEPNASSYVKLARLIYKFGLKSEEVEIFAELLENNKD